MMYHGRSIGRMLEWLRELTAHADCLVFHPGGKITLGQDKVVIEKTEWDEYDNPRFFFVGEEGERELVKEARERAYIRMREREFHILCYTMHPDHIHALEELESFPVRETHVRRDVVSSTVIALVELGMATKERKLIGWDNDIAGSPLFDINIEISPQGRGFLHAYRNENPWDD